MRIKSRIFNLTITILLTTIIVMLIPKDYFDAYKIKKISEESIVSDIKTYYCDLDNDANPEIIQYYAIVNSEHSINISNDTTFINLYNLGDGELSVSKNIEFADNAKDSSRAIYFISVQNGIAYLNILEYDKRSISFHVQKTPLDSVKYYNKAPDVINQFMKFTNDNKIVFDLQASINVQPRKLYIYDLQSKELKKSRNTNEVFNNLKVEKNGTENLFLPCFIYASGNPVALKQLHLDPQKKYNHEKNNAYQDTSFIPSFILYDNDLNYKFSLPGFSVGTNNTCSDFIRINNKLYIALLTWEMKNSAFQRTLNIVNLKGEIIKSKVIGSGNYYMTTNYERNELIVINGIHNEIKIFDNQLELRKRITNTSIKYIFGFKDLDDDKVPEFVTIEDGNLVVYENNMETKTSLPVSICNSEFSRGATFETFYRNDELLLNIEISNYAYIIKYVSNSLTYLKYPFYAIVFLLSYFFIWLLIKMNSRRLESENCALEKTVSERTKEIIQKNETLLQQKEELTLIAEELKAINENMAELNDFKEVMVGTIVHDLKNSLNCILNLSKDKNIIQPAYSMLNLVMNILDVQKYENNTMVLDSGDYMLDTILDKAIDKVDLLLEEKNITVVRKFSRGLQLSVDIHIMVRIFENLFTNAIKFSPLNEKIEIRAATSGENMVIIDVKDNGPGIPENKLPSIFNKFIQAESINSGKVASTGLGLTFCKMAIEAHKGIIKAKNDELKGAIFSFSMPGRELESTTKPNIERTSEKEYLLSGKTIKTLKPIVEKLNGIAIYEVTRIILILDKINQHENPEVQKWKEQIEQAVFACNTELYQKLIKLENTKT